MAMAIAMPAAASTKSPIIRSPTRSQMDEADHDPYFSLLQSEAADPSRNPSAADPSEFPSPADPSEPPSEDPSADPSANPSGYVSEDPSQQPAESPPFGEICSNRFDPTTVDGIQTEIHESSALHESNSACKNQLSNDTIGLAAMPSSPSSSSSPTGYVRGKAPHSHAATSIHKGAGIGKKKSLSPILRWFPRKKTESFLERKIRMLQEKEGGKMASLDETLGAAGVHLSRVGREKLAARTAAAQAMDARKNALIEASWCRILKLAGVPCKTAIIELQKAERKASAAMAEAEKLGVILHNGPPADRETVNQEGAVTASFDSAFEVDKDVAYAIKEVLQQLDDQSRDRNREHDYEHDHVVISDLLQSHITNTSQVPHGAINSENQCKELTTKGDGSSSVEQGCTATDEDEEEEEEGKEKRSSIRTIASMMLERIVNLSAEHQASLARIVATCGLSALLKDQSLEQEESMDVNRVAGEDVIAPASDLGSILVKHVSKLQREIEASKARTQFLDELEPGVSSFKRQQKEMPIESLDQVLIKRVSKLEKEKIAAAQESMKNTKSLTVAIEHEEGLVGLEEKLHEYVKMEQKEKPIESLDQILVKHISKLEKEKLAAAQEVPKQKCMKDTKSDTDTVDHDRGSASMDGYIKRKQKESPVKSLDQILVKHVSKLEKEKIAAAQAASQHEEGSLKLEEILTGPESYMKRRQLKGMPSESLDQILVKHVSRLEKEKLAAAQDTSKHEAPEETGDGRKSDGKGSSERTITGTVTATSMHELDKQKDDSASYGKIRHNHGAISAEAISDLGSILVKHVSRLEREKEAATMKGHMMTPIGIKQDYPKGSQRSHPEMDVPDLGSILVKHVSRLEKDKAKHAENEKQNMSIGLERKTDISVDVSLGDVGSREEDFLGNHREETPLTKDEKKTYPHGAKLQGRKQSDLEIVDHFSRRKLVREKQMEDVWGGLSLDNAMKRHVSKLELEQAAWREAEEEARQRPNMQ